MAQQEPRIVAVIRIQTHTRNENDPNSMCLDHIDAKLSDGTVAHYVGKPGEVTISNDELIGLTVAGARALAESRGAGVTESGVAAAPQTRGNMDRFITILTALRHGVPWEQWEIIEEELPDYARLSSGGPGWSVAPRYPITFESKKYDLAHPILVREDDSGRMSIVDYHDVVRVNADGADNAREVPHG